MTSCVENNPTTSLNTIIQYTHFTHKKVKKQQATV